MGGVWRSVAVSTSLCLVLAPLAACNPTPETVASCSAGSPAAAGAALRIPPTTDFDSEVEKARSLPILFVPGGGLRLVDAVGLARRSWRLEFTVRNGGRKDAGRFVVAVKDLESGRVVVECRSTGLRAGATERFTATVPVGRCFTYIGVQPDSQHQVREGDDRGGLEVGGKDFYREVSPCALASRKAVAPYVSTRGQFNPMTGTGVTDSTRYRTVGEIAGMSEDYPCAQRYAIAVHGWDNDERSAQTIFRRVRLSLRERTNSGGVAPFDGFVLGFAWDSDTRRQKSRAFPFDTVPLIKKEWRIGRDIARHNGIRLAQVVADLHARCPESPVVLVGHSLGVRVVLRAIEQLDVNPAFAQWRQERQKLPSVHLLGAAIDNEAVSRQGFHGSELQARVIDVFNYYAPGDHTLSCVYRAAEIDRALGLTGVDSATQPLPNYQDINVKQLLRGRTNCQTSPIGSFREHTDYYGRWRVVGDAADSFGAMLKVRQNLRTG